MWQRHTVTTDVWIWSITVNNFKTLIPTLFIVKHNLLPVNTTIILIIIVLVLIHN